ncbi:MAG: CBS domain-containing protein [Bacteroidales bacterium]|jgi:pentose-5-phosphate-3-epimerase/CBS domain-containing protein
MKISASIYSNKEKDFTELIKELDAHRIDYFHIDCNDEPEVFEDIKNIRKVSNTKIDLHLITPTPEKYYDLISKYNIENVTFQFEKLKNKIDVFSNNSSSYGLAIVSETDITVFDEYKNSFSHILFMSTTPGVSGGKFNRNNFRKIRLFKNLYPEKKIFVDGGVNEELSFILRNMGVYASVIGSYLFKNDYIGSALLNLKSDNIESHYLASDFMLGLDETPVLKINEFGFYDVLISIEKYQHGLTIVVNENGELEGLITNADMRRGLIKNFNDMNNIDINTIINRNPAYIYEKNTVTEILNYIKSLNFPVLYLPVVDEKKRLTGILKFNNLIKGEL